MSRLKSSKGKFLKGAREQPVTEEPSDAPNAESEFHSALDDIGLEAVLERRLAETQKKREWRVFIIQIIAVMLAVYLLMTVIAGITVIHGDSMQPAVHNGDISIIWRLNSRYEQGDIIMFASTASDEYLVKRVIGCPGDTVEIDGEGHVIVNNAILEEPYIYADTAPGSMEYPIILGADEYWCMGDNRTASLDSRDVRVGAVNKDDIVCRLIFVLRSASGS